MRGPPAWAGVGARSPVCRWRGASWQVWQLDCYEGVPKMGVPLRGFP